jgi:bla regulator protein blaR1
MTIILNWLWQSTLVVASIAVCLRGCASLSATRRETIWRFTLATVLGLPLLSIGAIPSPEALNPTAPKPLMALPAPTADLLPAVLFAWVAFALFGLGRVIHAYVQLVRTKRACSPFPADREARLLRWRAINQCGRPTILVVSDAVSSAAVLGLASPVIAISPGVMAALDADDLDHVIVHEWAHVQRRDDVVNLVQAVVRAVVGWHPAIRWILRQLDLERESACDERAVEIVGSATQYAGCLASLASRVGRERLRVPAAIGRAQLSVRIERVLARQRPARALVETASSLLAIVALAGAVYSVTRVELIGVARATEQFVEAAEAMVHANELAPEAVRAQPLATPASSPIPRAQKPVRVAVSRGRPVGVGEAAALLPGRPISGIPSMVSPAGGRSTASQGNDSAAIPNRPIQSLQAPAKDETATEAPREQAATQTPWSAAADAGVAIGHGSQKAAVATAGMFKRMSQSLARAF